MLISYLEDLVCDPCRVYVMMEQVSLIRIPLSTITFFDISFNLYEWQPLLKVNMSYWNAPNHEYCLLKNSYESQHKAVLGMIVRTRGVRPRPNPFSPSLCQITLKASAIPLTPRMSASPDVPLVCNIVLATSKGVVTAAATAPATAPEVICVVGEYSPDGFIKRFSCS